MKKYLEVMNTKIKSGLYACFTKKISKAKISFLDNQLK